MMACMEVATPCCCAVATRALRQGTFPVQNGLRLDSETCDAWGRQNREEAIREAMKSPDYLEATIQQSIEDRDAGELDVAEFGEEVVAEARRRMRLNAA